MYPLSDLRDCTSLTYFILYILLILSKKTSAFLALSAVNNPCNPCVPPEAGPVPKKVCACLRLPCGILPSASSRSEIPQGRSEIRNVFFTLCPLPYAL